MFLDTSKIKAPSGKTYSRVLLRMAYREDGKVKHRTLGNLSYCSKQEINAIRFALKNKDRLPEILARGGQADYSSRQGLSLGSVYLVNEIAKRLGITKALGTDRNAKLALWQICARVIEQGSRLSAVRLAGSHAACDVLGINTTFNEDNLYNNLDWLCENQSRIEQRLFKLRYPDKKPQIFLYDVTSSYLEGVHNELASAQLVHERYKDLALVEWAFRTCKTFVLEMRPVNVRKASRTRGHIFVVMLAYMIAKELRSIWSAIDTTVEEALNELSTLCLTEICDNGVVVCNAIPVPRESVKRLLDAAKVIMPEVLPSKGVLVVTRKTLPENRQPK
jgi:hypothetical protein